MSFSRWVSHTRRHPSAILLVVQLVGITLAAVFAFLRALLFLPARLLGHKP